MMGLKIISLIYFCYQLIESLSVYQNQYRLGFQDLLLNFLKLLIRTQVILSFDILSKLDAYKVSNTNTVGQLRVETILTEAIN